MSTNNTKNDFTDLLNKLPLASTVLVDSNEVRLNPTSYTLLSFLIRYGYTQKGNFCLSIDHLHKGIEGWILPTMTSKSKPMHHMTIRKARQVLIDLGFISYTNKRAREGTVIGVYTLHLLVIRKLVNKSYSDFIKTKPLDNLLENGLRRGEEDDGKYTNQCMVKDLITDTDTLSIVNLLTNTTTYIYHIILSISITLGAIRFLKLTAKLVSLLKNMISVRAVYKAVSDIMEVGLLLLTYSSDDHKIHVIAIPAIIRHKQYN